MPKVKSVVLDGLGRKHLSSSVADDHDYRLHARFWSPISELLHPISLIEAAVLQFLPPPLNTPKLQVAWSYASPLSLIVCNAKQVFTELVQFPIRLTGLCPCHRFGSCLLSPMYGGLHVHTRDLNIIQQPRLRLELMHGLSHIPICSPHIPDIMQCNCAVLSQFVQDYVLPMAIANGVMLGPEFEAQCINRAKDWMQERLDSNAHIAAALPVCDISDHSAVRACLEHLHSFILVAEHDKAAAHPFFLCKRVAQHIVMARLSSPTSFVQIDPFEIDAYTSECKQVLVRIHPKLADLVLNDSLPYLRLSYKAHKHSYRFICNGQLDLNVNISAVAQLVLSELMYHMWDFLVQQQKNIKAFTGINCRLCFIIKNSADFLLNLPENVQSAFSLDVQQCFENIPLDDDDPLSLMQSIRWLVNTTFGASGLAHPAIIVSLKSATSEAVSARLSSALHQDKQLATLIKISLCDVQVIKLLQFVIHHALIHNNGLTFRQTRGIAMGNCCSPLLCDIFLLWNEYKAALRILQLDDRPTAMAKLSEWHYCFRLMDDICALNAPFLYALMINTGSDSTKTDWVYPSCLDLSTTFRATKPGDAGVFLDVKLALTDHGHLTTAMHFKSSKLPFVPVQYISCVSNRPSQNCYSVVLALVDSAVLHASSTQIAFSDIRSLVRTLSGRGFDVHRLYRLIMRRLCSLELYPAVRINLQDLHIQIMNLC